MVFIIIKDCRVVASGFIALLAENDNATTTMNNDEPVVNSIFKIDVMNTNFIDRAVFKGTFITEEQAMVTLELYKGFTLSGTKNKLFLNKNLLMNVTLTWQKEGG